MFRRVEDRGSAASEEWPGALKRALAREELVSERLRAVIFASLIGAGLALYLVASLVPGVARPDLQHGLRRLLPQGVGLFSASMLFESTLAGLVTLCLRHGLQPHPAWKYATAAVEATLPTLAILVWRQEFDPLTALASVTSLFYLLFILFTTIRLSFGLSVFTGALAGVEYVIVSLCALAGDGHIDPGSLLAYPAHHVMVGCMYLLAGLMAGVAAVRIRRQYARSIQHLQDRNRVVGIFGQHVSPEVVEKLLRQETELEGELRSVCVMFLDLRDFSRFAQNHAPEQVVSYLNRLFAFMVDAVNRQRGIINRFLGDGFMAVFGAPVEDRENCRHAVEAATEIAREVERMNAAGQLSPPARVGVGLHCGQAVAGNVGSTQRKEYTLIGPVVNVACQIEQLNKQFASSVLVSEEVWRACGQSIGQPLGEVSVKGMDRALRVVRLA